MFNCINSTLHCLFFYSRVVGFGGEKTIGSHKFTHWGAHYNDFPCVYFTAAAAIGLTTAEIHTFIKRLDQVFTKFSARQRE